jgi:hypothetical protein
MKDGRFQRETGGAICQLESAIYNAGIGKLKRLYITSECRPGDVCPLPRSESPVTAFRLGHFLAIIPAPRPGVLSRYFFSSFSMIALGSAFTSSSHPLQQR